MPGQGSRRVAEVTWLSAHPRGTVIECWVVPGASRTEVKGIHGNALRIRVTSPPEGGAANREACRLIADGCGTRAELIAGGASRRKRILVFDRVPAEVAAALMPDYRI